MTSADRQREMALGRLREAVASETSPLIPFVGAGVASAVTDEACASWRGLLQDGIELCRQCVGSSPDWVERMNQHLVNADAISFVTVANEVRQRLEPSAGGENFASWLKESVGSLVPDDGGWELISEIRRLSDPRLVIVTTNYDTLLERAGPVPLRHEKWKALTWNAKNWSSALGERKTVLHLHGMAADPKSVILSSADYERILRDNLDNIVSQFILLQRFLYIGCGDGLSDPHIARLMNKARDVLSAKREDEEPRPEQFMLVRGGELRRLVDNPLPEGITPVAYGREFSELTGFLSKLAKGLTPDVSQNPYDFDPIGGETPAAASPGPSSRTDEGRRAPPVRLVAGASGTDPPVTPLSRQVLANEQIDEALAPVRRAARAMDLVAECVALRTGMTTWDPADQLAEHQLIADSANEPAARLRDQLREACEAVGRARAVGTAGRVKSGSALLGAQASAAEVLEALTAELAQQVTMTCTDLAGRAVDSSIRYRSLADIAHTAQEEAEEAHRRASDLRQLLEPRAARDTTEQAAVQPDDGHPSNTDPDARTRASQQAEAPTAPVTEIEMDFPQPKLVASAGLGTDRELHDAEPVPVPLELAGKDRIVVLVEGDSMIQAKIHDGDYLIVDTRQQSISPNEIAVFQKEGPGQPEKFVKRITVGEDAANYHAENPDYPDGTMADGDNARLIGKVIAVFRRIR